MTKKRLKAAVKKDSSVRIAILEFENGESHIRVKNNNKVKKFLNRNFLIKEDNSLNNFRQELSADGVVDVIKNGVIIESSIKTILSASKLLKRRRS